MECKEVACPIWSIDCTHICTISCWCANCSQFMGLGPPNMDSLSKYIWTHQTMNSSVCTLPIKYICIILSSSPCKVLFSSQCTILSSSPSKVFSSSPCKILSCSPCQILSSLPCKVLSSLPCKVLSKSILFSHTCKLLV